MTTLDLSHWSQLRSLGQPPGFEPVESISHPADAKESHSIVDFLNRELRSTVEFSIRQEFPSFFGEFPGGTSLLVRKGNRIVSHLGYLVREYQHSAFRMKVGLVGLIAATEETRDSGVNLALLEAGLAELKRKGCVVCVMWSEREEFFSKFGFHRAGQERDFRFTPGAVPSVSNPPVEFDFQKHLSQMWRMFHRNEGRTDRSLEEQKVLLSTPRVRVFVTQDKGRVTSYLVINKGVDFRDYIHEWGGEGEALKQNIAWTQKEIYPNRNLTLIAPTFNNLDFVRSIADREWSGVLGLIKVLDKSALLDAHMKYLISRKIPFSVQDEDDEISIDGKTLPVGSDLECLEVVLGTPHSDTKTVLPFFLWGFDSI